jgi:two-component system, OmpR family, aerobic respiration control sensor histidine kinase ArcB
MKLPIAPTTGEMFEELALLAYDMRSAIADMSASLARIDASAFTSQNLTQLDDIKAANDSLSRLLDEGLNTLLVQALPTLDFAPTNLADLLRDLQRRWAQSKGQQPNCVQISTSNLPATVMCNRTAVERLLANLLSNALAHSGGQPVVLTATCPTPSELRITISDVGPDFPDANRHAPAPANIPTMPVWQDNAGHELGLRIAHSLAQRMNATLHLQNLQNGGALAELVLPLSIPAADTPAPIDTNFLLGKSILIADESMPQLIILQRYLHEAGANITLAHDGPTAAAALQNGAFDLALISFELPGRSGLEICRALRDHPAPQGSPARVIMLAAQYLPEFEKAAKAAGADQILVKPITSAADLFRAICAPLPEPGPDFDPTTFSRLLDMAGPVVGTELAMHFKNDLISVQTQLLAALPVLDWPALDRASHVLIALAGTAGMPKLESSARVFNLAANARDGITLNLHQKALLGGLAELLEFIARIAQERQSQP